ncbi:MAG: hypothetical protein M3430_05930 [Acidobacteriota bacterium]|nr:hypothetical protein [Acidobacteriota bacterium]
MAHEVSINLNTSIVLHKDVEIVVRTDEGKLGTLLVSKGNIEWLPANKSVNKRRLPWKAFAELMADQGRPVKVKK